MHGESPAVNLLHADPAEAAVAVHANHLIAAAELLDGCLTPRATLR